MNTPLYKYGLFGDETSLIVAFILLGNVAYFVERRRARS